MNSAQWPFRVDCVTAASLTEWRIGDELEPRPAGDWQLVYLRSGIVEEFCDDRRVTLRPGQLLFHQPEEVHAMRAVGEALPSSLRETGRGGVAASPSAVAFREKFFGKK